MLRMRDKRKKQMIETYKTNKSRTIMALRIKAKEKKLKFSKTDEGVYRYVMLPELYSALS